MPLVRRLALAWFVRRSARRAARIITISDFARREIADAFGIGLDAIIVTHLAPLLRTAVSESEAESRLAKLGIQKPYLISFSSPSPHKNIPILLRAFAMARETHRFPHQLVLVGHLPPGLSIGRDGIRDDSVRVVGYLQDADLSAVMTGAELLVFPSLYEGFGLPVLEAMSAGVPVVCSDRASLPEVAGDAALFFDPTNVSEISEMVARAVTDQRLRESLRERGRHNASRFSWDRTAAETLAVYRRVLGSDLCAPEAPRVS
jgi:glycosyltransferase involved in cell wall biosynthesis